MTLYHSIIFYHSKLSRESSKNPCLNRSNIPTHLHLPCDLGATAAPSFLTVPAATPLMMKIPMQLRHWISMSC